MTKPNSFEENIQMFQQRIGENITRLMKKREITQTKLKEKCAIAGYDISQATISNAKQGKGNLTISNLLAIAHALEVDILELLDVPFTYASTVQQESDDASAITPEMFIRNPNSAFMKSYLGTYHTLFLKTSGSKEDLIDGILEITANKDGTTCDAVFKLQIDEIDSSTGYAAEKIYKGELIISQAMRAVYCYLVNSAAGEICMLIFQHIYTSYRNIETAMAVAVTTASGSNRRPTVHRMCISRAPIEQNMREYVKGQLLMNTADIYLTHEQLDALYRNNKIPSSFRDILKKATFKRECYCIPEAALYDSSLSEEEQLKCISLVRANSKAPKYNKISRRTDEALYTLLGKKDMI